PVPPTSPPPFTFRWDSRFFASRPAKPAFGAGAPSGVRTPKDTVSPALGRPAPAVNAVLEA
ncbi:MAG: hypothetical protein WD249_12510, partial [Gaiellaceae bacterium]